MMKLTLSHDGFDLDIDLALSTRERIGIVGPNGAGKSTMLRTWLALASAKLTPPTAVLLEQESLCFPHMTALENVAFAPRAQARRAADTMLTQVGLGSVAHRLPHELSGGQNRQVALLRALATGAPTLLLDEPMAGLDVETAAEYRARLREQSALLSQLVIVTHDPTDLKELVDRVLVLDHGRLVADCPVDTFFTHPPTSFAANLIAR
jgi:molybdate transport system ATP-binding protein